MSQSTSILGEPVGSPPSLIEAMVKVLRSHRPWILTRAGPSERHVNLVECVQ
jgi:hypothetical protein